MLRLAGMPLFELTDDDLVEVTTKTFTSEGIGERQDLQRVLQQRIEIIAPDCMVLAEEFGAWEDSRRRVDLLCLDRDARLVVVELKRDETAGHAELQAIRYAAMVSTMTFEQAARTHGAYLESRGDDRDPGEAILSFLGWGSDDEGEFGGDVRVVLVSGDFSKELTTAVIWLNERDLDIRCVQLRLHVFEGRRLIDVKQVLPLPEVVDYQVRVREKEREERVRASGRDLTKFDVTVDGVTHERLPKRRAMLEVVRALVAKGVAPGRIAELVPWRARSFWFDVDGVVGEDEFCRLAAAESGGNGAAFVESRWCVGDDELIRAGGRTYALSRRWGRRTSEAIANILAAFPSHGVGCRDHGL